MFEIQLYVIGKTNDKNIENILLKSFISFFFLFNFKKNVNIYFSTGKMFLDYITNGAE